MTVPSNWASEKSMTVSFRRTSYRLMSDEMPNIYFQLSLGYTENVT